MKDVRAEVSAELRKIQGFLRDWDPIGVIPDLVAAGHPPDEYVSYASGIHSLLRRGCQLQDLTSHLEDIRTASMELQAAPDHDRMIAARILDWWNNDRQRGASLKDSTD